ncbi:MAG TPA: cupin domain-containing protein [Candidatus Binatia bacterium]
MDYSRFAHINLTPFEQWVQAEGLKVITTHTVPDMMTAELEPWKRTGCLAALLDMTHDPSDDAMINNQGTTRYLVEIPPGGTFKPEKHMYEEIFYVLKGRGATVVWNEGSSKLTFEWDQDAVFAIPLNAWHEIHNGSGSESVRLYAATNMPTAFNLYGSPEFVFDCANTFNDRFDPNDETYFSRKSTKIEDRFLQSNFIPSVTKLALDNWAHRGPGSNMNILMAGGRFICHVSEFPPASYKKAHGFGTGAATGGRSRTGLTNENSYLFLSGEGYDLQWDPGVKPGPGVEWKRFDFKKGSLMTNGQAGHQHFNPSGEPARYLVLRYGNDQFGLREGQGRQSYGRGQERRPQIEFKDEEPRIRALFEEECRRHGVTSNMPPV